MTILECLGVVGGQPNLPGDLHSFEQPFILAILNEPLDRLFKRAPHGDIGAAGGEKNGADSRHRAVAENRDAGAAGHRMR